MHLFVSHKVPSRIRTIWHNLVSVLFIETAHHINHIKFQIDRLITLAALRDMQAGSCSWQSVTFCTAFSRSSEIRKGFAFCADWLNISEMYSVLKWPLGEKVCLLFRLRPSTTQSSNYCWRYTNGWLFLFYLMCKQFYLWFFFFMIIMSGFYHVF